MTLLSHADLIERGARFDEAAADVAQAFRVGATPVLNVNHGDYSCCRKEAWDVTEAAFAAAIHAQTEAPVGVVSDFRMTPALKPKARG